MTTFTYSGYVATFRANGTVSAIADATMDVVAEGADATIRYTRTYTGSEPDDYIHIEKKLLTLRIGDATVPLYRIAELNTETEQLSWPGGVSNILSIELGDGRTFLMQISGDALPDIGAVTQVNDFIASIRRVQLLDWGFYGPNMDIPLSRIGNPEISEQDVISGDKYSNTLRGGIGNDWIFGAGGSDALHGGAGRDTLIGGSGNDRLSGGSGQDLLRGGAGADTLDGGGGADRMAGGSGNDTYIVNATGDLISEARRGGVDHVRTSVDLTLAANVENLTMTGKADLTAVGNSSANLMTGNSGRNMLNGARGNDTLNGGGGNDRLTGGQGNDLLKGGTGADTLDGGSGRDLLTGGGGADVFVFAAGSGRDVITDFRKSADMIQLRDLGVSSFSEVRALATRVDGDVVIRFGEGDTLILRDTTIQALSEAMIFV